MSGSKKLSDYIAKLDSGKYKVLAIYFPSLYLEDLATLKEDDLLEIIKPTEKLLMRNLIKLHLFKHLEQPNPFHSMHLIPPIPLEKSRKKITKENVNSLELKKRVCSKQFKGLTTYIATDELADVLDKNIFGSILYVDLSSNNLFDIDLPEIAKFVALLPNCKLLDISFNRFEGIRATCEELETSIIAILNLKNMQFLDICGNSIASIEKKDFFYNLSPEHLEKLIWIPKNWLQGDGWKMVVPEEVWRLVQKVHGSYYSNVRPKYLIV
jgi:hypothetical protein